VITLDELRGFRTYARGLGAYLSSTLCEAEARARIVRSLAEREQSFLALLEGGVYANPRNPYRRLLAHARIELGDVARLIANDGLETTLSRLHDAGIWLSLAEVKGKEPVRRTGLEFQIAANDLHNPLARRHFEATTGGSRSAGTSFWVDLDDVLHAAAYAVIARAEFGLTRAEGALWFPAPPGVAGMRRALWWSKAGTTLRRWFAQTVPRWRPGEMKRAAFVRWTVLASRRAGRPCPLPSTFRRRRPRGSRAGSRIASAKGIPQCSSDRRAPDSAPAPPRPKRASI